MSFVIDINESEFLKEVVEKSKTIPVIVDFWAPWCGPCKQLTPILEKLVNNKNGKVILAKINVDENQGIASQLNIQSIPTVYGFVDGKPIDAFQGAQPESKIEIMINKLIESSPGNEVKKLIEEAEQFYKNQNYSEAQKLYENLVTMDPGNIKIISGLLRTLVKLKKFDDANELIESLDETIIQNEEVLKIKKLIDDNLNNKNCEELIDKLIEKLKSQPNDIDTRYQLAVCLLQANQIENGFNELLNIFNQDPKWNDEAAKKKLLEYFDLLGFSDPNVIDGRKKLSSMMFK